MLTDIVRTNFSFSRRVKDVLNQFFSLPSDQRSQDSTTLPYICWSYGGWRIEGDRAGEVIAPGYRFGEIEAERVKGGIVIAHDGDRHVAIGLHEAYDNAAFYMIDCIDRQLTIVATR